MNAVNYDKVMQQQLKEAKGALLMHACCAPCSSACLERLKDYFKITVLFYNPNIETDEYLKRKNELIRFINETGYAEILDCDHDTAEFYNAVKGLEKEKEGGKRCEECFKLRIEKTAEIAEREKFNYFCTTLTLSPLKNANLINEIGENAAKGKNAKWLYSDFKKRDGYKRSLTLSAEHNLYRQNFCGCVFSKAQRLDKK